MTATTALALSLRPMTEADLERKVKWANDEVVNQHIGFTDRVDLPGTRRWFAGQQANPDIILFTLVADEQAIGYAKFLRDPNGNQGEYQGAAIGEHQYWGRGLGKQMVTQLLRHAFEVEGWDRLWGHFPAWNARSIGLHQAMGFQIVGKADHKRRHPGDGKEYEVLVLAFERANYSGVTP
ncbi:MAG: GNAT family N-acetyltransferase [Deltaproteobacteria bacterium]|nr:GNAT family N-acetyltransferase [Deltaproteobacteria bacterium]